MLDTNKLATLDPTLNDEDWFRIKNGKFSASEMGVLISAKSHQGVFTAGAISHIQGKAGEFVTGTRAKQEFHNANTNHGNAMEAEAIAYFCQKMNKTAFRDTVRGDTRMLIVQDDYSCATPDALIAMADQKYIFDESGTRLKVAPLEIKCPPVLHRFIKLYECKTPVELKLVQKLYYYQVLTQMIFCESLTGYFACYHKDFPNPMRVIEFRQAELTEDIARVKKTLEHAIVLMKQKVNDLQEVV